MGGVLIDTSGWISFFKHGDGIVSELISEDIVCTNELILTEILPVLYLKKQEALIESLNSIPVLPLNIDWSLIRGYQVMNLERGVNKVGIPDLIILQQVIEQKLSFYTLDKHFKLMNEFLVFELL